MLHVNFIRENKELVIKRLAKRNFDAAKIIEDVIDVDSKRRKAQTQLDNHLALANQVSKEMALYYKTKKIQGNDSPTKIDIINYLNNLQALAEKHKGNKRTTLENLKYYEEKLNELLYKIPNVPNELVPAGNSEDDNEEVYREGDIPELPKNALPHWELASKYDIIDFELGNKITGAGFPVYKGKGAKLQRALINYFLDKNTAAGYDEVQVPHMVNEASGFGTGQLPDKEGQMYHVNGNGDNFYLIPTAEVPATNLFRGDLLTETELPKAITAYTPCFRREAGSYGAHVRGLNRLHQFDKVEILRVEHPDRSYDALNEMVEHVKNILRELKLPYRILRLCGGDLGFTSALTYDFEVYSTAQERWLEISSVSNFETFQANRLKLRFKNSEGKSQLAHTLNGSSLALPRVLAGILENYQTDNGINIPEILVPYTGFSTIE